jgi:hypothetical protein
MTVKMLKKDQDSGRLVDERQFDNKDDAIRFISDDSGYREEDVREEIETGQPTFGTAEFFWEIR